MACWRYCGSARVLARSVGCRGDNAPPKRDLSADSLHEILRPMRAATSSISAQDGWLPGPCSLICGRRRSRRFRPTGWYRWFARGLLSIPHKKKVIGPWPTWFGREVKGLKKVSTQKGLATRVLLKINMVLIKSNLRM